MTQKRIRHDRSFTEPERLRRALFDELRKRGYEVIPINPQASEVLGQRCFARIQDVPPPVDTALLMTSAEVTDAVVSDCAEAGVRRFWMYRTGGKGAVGPTAVAFGQQRGIRAVPGQ